MPPRLTTGPRISQLTHARPRNGSGRFCRLVFELQKPLEPFIVEAGVEVGERKAPREPVRTLEDPRVFSLLDDHHGAVEPLDGPVAVADLGRDDLERHPEILADLGDVLGFGVRAPLRLSVDLLDPELLPEIVARSTDDGQFAQFIGGSRADGGQVRDFEALPRFRVQEQHYGGDAPVPLDHDQLVAVFLNEDGFVREIAARTNGHCQLIDGHLLPQDLKQLLLGRLAAQGVFRQAGILGIEQELPYRDAFINFRVIRYLLGLRFGHRSTRPSD